MRVLMVIGMFRPYIGGAEIQAEKLAEELIRCGWEVDILTGRWSENLSPRETLGRLHIIRLDTGSRWFHMKGLRKIQRLFFLIGIYRYILNNSERYSIIHGHSALQHTAVASRAGFKTGIPVLAKTSSSGLTGDLRVLSEYIEGSWMKRWIYKYINRIVYTSELARDEFIQADFPVNKLVYIPNGVVVDEVHPQKIVTQPEIKMITVARLSFEKGIDILVHAIEYLRKNYTDLPRFSLIVLGDGPERANVEQLIRTAGLEHVITLAGNQSNPSEYLQKSDLFVLPSRCEGMSNALLEAMASGLKCIATQVGSNATVLAEGQAGWLVHPENPQALAEKIFQAFSGEPAWTEEKRTAWVKNEFGIHSVALRYIQLYNTLLEERAQI